MSETLNDRPLSCPRCQSPLTQEGQPSRRRFFGCGSYIYAGESGLRDQTDLCEAREAVNAATILFQAIARDEVNHQDEAEKWLRAFAP